MTQDKQCFVSILVPVYNAEKYLSECIESILSQTFKDFEAIFLNDGSKDNSMEILEKYAAADKRIKVLSQHNKGVGYTRNSLMSAASGQFIMFVDSDDAISPDCLEKLLAAQKETNADVVRCSWNELKDGNLLPPSCSSKRNKKIGDSTADRIYAGFYDSIIWGKLIKLDLIKKNGIKFNENAVAEDLSFAILLLAFADKVLDIKDRLFQYRKDSEGSITTRRDRMIIGRLNNIVYACDFLDKKDRLRDSRSCAMMSKFLLWNSSSLLKLTLPDVQAEKDYSDAVLCLRRLYPRLSLFHRIKMKLFFSIENLLKGRKRFALCKIWRNF